MLAFAAAFLAAGAADAMTFTVNSTADDPDPVLDGVCATAGGSCTLRAAIQEANWLPNFILPNGVELADRIVPPAGTYVLTRIGDDDTAVDGDLDITDGLIISGAGPGNCIIDGNGDVTVDRVFDVRGAVVVNISAVTNTNPKCNVDADPDAHADVRGNR